MPLLLLLCALLATTPGSAEVATSAAFTESAEDAALQLSQAALGRSLESYALLDPTGRRIVLDDLRGKPLLISPVYTSCYHTCSMATRALATVVDKARATFGQQSFTVITIGFDTPADTPQAMGHFAQQQGVTDPNWYFLSGDTDTLRRLTANIGFSYTRSPKGFDHLMQTTLVDAKGVVYRQLYGEVLPTPLLLEPLKELILGVPPPAENSMATLLRRVRLFCTTYDPSADAYRFDYSLFVGLFIGASIILTTGFLLFREWRRTS